MYRTAHAPLAIDQDLEPSLDASDEFVEPASARYCPTGLLASFTLLMAGHGRSVSTSMMLGDREYAMWQLARARTMSDDQLDVIAARLFSYFDDPRGWCVARPA